eukprot:352896-Chlamydomonas_euryale.AAC.2
MATPPLLVATPATPVACRSAAGVSTCGSTRQSSRLRHTTLKGLCAQRGLGCLEGGNAQSGVGCKCGGCTEGAVLA